MSVLKPNSRPLPAIYIDLVFYHQLTGEMYRRMINDTYIDDLSLLSTYNHVPYWIIQV